MTIDGPVLRVYVISDIGEPDSPLYNAAAPQQPRLPKYRLGAWKTCYYDAFASCAKQADEEGRLFVVGISIASRPRAGFRQNLLS